MSKRYGRNQRRRHREAIAALQQQAVGHRETIASEIKKNLALSIECRRFTAQIEALAEIVGRHHVAFPPQVRDYDPRRSGPSFRTPALTVRGEFEKLLSQKVPADRLADRLLCHDVIYTHLATDDMRDQVHFRVAYGENEMGYALSRHTVMRAPPHRLALSIAKEMTAMLERDIHLYQQGLGQAPWQARR